MEQLGDYTIIKKLGDGPFGEVFLAEHRFIKKQFALKLLSADFGLDPQFVRAFELQIAEIATLDHPYIAKVHNVSFASDRYFIVTDAQIDSLGVEMHLGRYLRLKGKGLLEEERLSLLKQIASALDYAHEMGVFHGSLKLSNILIGANGEPLLCDFGLSRMVGEKEALMRLCKEAAAHFPSERFLKDLAFLAPEQKSLGEEEELKAEHEKLVNAKELIEGVGNVASLLTEGAEMPTLKRALNHLDASTRLDQKLKEPAQAMRSAILELSEVGRVCQSYLDRLEINPQRLGVVEERIGAINALKKRFGQDVASEKKRLLSQQDHLLHLEEKLEEKQKKLSFFREKKRLLLEHLTKQREEAAPRLAALVLGELKGLNIPNAQFEIRVLDESVALYFSANLGHPMLPIQECASGGEMSRLFLAIKLILSDGKKSYIFDEIDGNIGGQTATLLGEKLQTLAKKKQIICVTHFVQVAKYAFDHYRVSKTTEDNTSYTRIKKLDAKEKEEEYNRMLGYTP